MLGSDSLRARIALVTAMALPALACGKILGIEPLVPEDGGGDGAADQAVVDVRDSTVGDTRTTDTTVADVADAAPDADAATPDAAPDGSCSVPDATDSVGDCGETPAAQCADAAGPNGEVIFANFDNGCWPFNDVGAAGAVADLSCAHSVSSPYSLHFAAPALGAFTRDAYLRAIFGGAPSHTTMRFELYVNSAPAQGDCFLFGVGWLSNAAGGDGVSLQIFDNGLGALGCAVGSYTYGGLPELYSQCAGSIPKGTWVHIDVDYQGDNYDAGADAGRTVTLLADCVALYSGQVSYTAPPGTQYHVEFNNTCSTASDAGLEYYVDNLDVDIR